jgi:ubiquinone/menaquinone biosynthesis C-methylase UbiE
MTETARIQGIYDARAATYDRSLGITERLALSALRRRYGSLLRGETIEVAIGTGLGLSFYSSDVTRAVGVDLSLPMLRIARERAAALGRPIALVQADAEALPFADASFDTVAISLALCTIPNPTKTLMELARVCRPEGRVVLLEHVLSPTQPIALAQRLLSPAHERAMGCHLDRKTVDLARELGFAALEEEQRLFGIFRLVVARPLQANSNSTQDRRIAPSPEMPSL